MENEKNKRSYTEAYQTHEDCGYGYKVVCFHDDKYSKDIRIYRGENAVYKFMENILEEVKYCKSVINPISPGRFNTFSTWGGGADSAPSVTLVSLTQIEPNLVW